MSGRPLVLIADHDADAAQRLAVYLRPLRCEVLRVTDGEEALAVAQSRLPQIVLLAVSLPKRSGWDVCQTLKGVQRTSRITVVLIAGGGDVKDRLTGLQLGADDYLVKPFDRDQVVRRIAGLLERRGGNRTVEFEMEARPASALLVDRATGLPTVPMVLGRLKEMLIEQGEIGIVHIDIEQFESIEAEYGWAFFDEFVRCTGEVVGAEAKARFRNAVVAASMPGGSSFFIFFETRGADSTQDALFEGMTADLGARLVEEMRLRFPNMQEGQIGFFVGAARIEYRPQIRLERQLYQGMQTAAEAVRDAEQQRKRQLGRELRDIIRRNRVTTLFQPIVRARESTVFGYEILTRGPANSPFRNSDMLFSFARETPQAWELEAMALEGALRRLRSFELGERRFLLNLEAEMFSRAEFRIHEVISFFAEHRGQFVFELTERAAIEDFNAFRTLFDEFRSKGIELAIDDAGSGYASLEAIAALAPDFLKISRGLVSTLAVEPVKQDLVKMLVDLAGKIAARTIAEGIETAEDYEACRALGIDLLQGYYLAHPAEELAEGDAEVMRHVKGA